MTEVYREDEDEEAREYILPSVGGRGSSSRRVERCRAHHANTLSLLVMWPMPGFVFCTTVALLLPSCFFRSGAGVLAALAVALSMASRVTVISPGLLAATKAISIWEDMVGTGYLGVFGECMCAGCLVCAKPGVEGMVYMAVVSLELEHGRLSFQTRADAARVMMAVSRFGFIGNG